MFRFAATFWNQQSRCNSNFVWRTHTCLWLTALIGWSTMWQYSQLARCFQELLEEDDGKCH